MMVIQEIRVLGKYLALGGLFNITFQRHDSFFARFVKKRVHHFQQVQILLLGNLRALENRDQTGSDLLQDVKWISNENRTPRCAADDDEFGRLEKNADIAVLHFISGNDRSEYHDNSDNRKHGILVFTTAGFLPACRDTGPLWPNIVGAVCPSRLPFTRPVGVSLSAAIPTNFNGLIALRVLCVNLRIQTRHDLNARTAGLRAGSVPRLVPR